MGVNMNNISKSVIVLGLAALLLPSIAFSQAAGEGAQPWAFRSGVLLTGSSDMSEPEGFKVYSAITLEMGVSRRLNRFLDLELGLAPESHEVDRAAAGGARTNLGSLELLPLTLVLLYRPVLGGSIHPYGGAGLNLTVCWEKSGALDSADVSTSLGPAFAAGVDFDLAPRLMFNLNFKWFPLTTDVDLDGERIARLKIHPASLSAGLKFRF
jgi:outer membrane protein W